MTTLRTHLLFAWLLLFWLDGVLTYIGLQYLGVREMNMTLIALAQFGLLAAIVFLKAIGALATMVIMAVLRPKLTILPMAIAVGIYVAVASHPRQSPVSPSDRIISFNAHSAISTLYLPYRSRR